MEEIWKDIKGFEGLYQISSFGRVYSRPRKGTKGGIKTPVTNRKGYLSVQLSGNGQIITTTIHRLVAEAFIPNPNNLPQVNHKDENKTNNYMDNLEWCTNDYNQHYGSRTERASLSCSKEIYCYETNLYYLGAKEASEKLGLDPSSITKVCKGIHKSVGGYHFCYSSDKKENPNLSVGGKKAVLCIETNIVYSCAEEASLQTGAEKTTIAKVCRGIGKTAGGYHWKYVDQ